MFVACTTFHKVALTSVTSQVCQQVFATTDGMSLPVTDLGSATGGDVSSFPSSALAVGMVNQRAGRRVDERRQEAAGFFYFRRLRSDSTLSEMLMMTLTN